MGQGVHAGAGALFPDSARSLRKNDCGTVEIQWLAHLGRQENTFAGCSKRSSSKAAGTARTGGVPSGAHGATNKEHHVCARRRVSEAAGSPLRILSSRERCWRTF
jgi:hypothetical protein